ncbi:MAG: hypothetical protein AAGE86_10755 [Pseudomonadota bacterium]
MKSKTWLLSYRPFRTEDEEKKFIAYISSSRYFDDWSHPYVGLFFVTSDYEGEQLYETIRAYLQSGHGFAVLEFSPDVTAFGNLQTVVFDWLSSRLPDVERFPPPEHDPGAE